jgi:hypothetical protein
MYFVYSLLALNMTKSTELFCFSRITMFNFTTVNKFWVLCHILLWVTDSKESFLDLSGAQLFRLKQLTFLSISQKTKVG